MISIYRRIRVAARPMIQRFVPHRISVYVTEQLRGSGCLPRPPQASFSRFFGNTFFSGTGTRNLQSICALLRLSRLGLRQFGQNRIIPPPPGAKSWAMTTSLQPTQKDFDQMIADHLAKGSARPLPGGLARRRAKRHLSIRGIPH